MSLSQGFDWKYDDHHFQGYSLAGQTTSIYFKEPKVCFDIGQGLPFHLSAKLFCLSHLHADHGSGIHYLLSQRSLFRLPEVPILVPAQHCSSIQKIIREWEKIEELKFSYQLIPVEEGLTFDLSSQWQVRAYPTPHRISSFGYIIFTKKKKLKDQYQNLAPHELILARSKGQPIDQIVYEPTVAFTGDTRIEFIETHPEFGLSQVLLMECTYLDHKKSIEETRRWGHIHLDEIIERQSLFKNEKVGLIHLSARYTTAEANKILKEKLSTDFRARVEIFPRPF
jgi:ribonuclease Z